MKASAGRPVRAATPRDGSEAEMTPGPRVVVLSSAFPRRGRPAYAPFVRERVRHVAARCPVVVVAPIPWFPGNRWWRGADEAATPLVDRQAGLRVYHPRFLCLPGLGKCLDAFLYFVSLLP